MPGVWVVSRLRSVARMRCVLSSGILVGLPAAPLLLELRALARDPVLDEAAQLDVVRQRLARAGTVRALERHGGLGHRDREHPPVAGLPGRPALPISGAAQ